VRALGHALRLGRPASSVQDAARLEWESERLAFTVPELPILADGDPDEEVLRGIAFLCDVEFSYGPFRYAPWPADPRDALILLEERWQRHLGSAKWAAWMEEAEWRA
jgi:hypothetical protein